MGQRVVKNMDKTMRKQKKSRRQYWFSNANKELPSHIEPTYVENLIESMIQEAIYHCFTKRSAAERKSL